MPTKRLQNIKSQRTSTQVETIAVDLSRYQECFIKDRAKRIRLEMNNKSLLPSKGPGKHIGSTIEIEPLLLDLASNQTITPGIAYQKLGHTPFLFDTENQSVSEKASSEMLSNIQQLAGDNVQDLISAFETVIQPSLPVVTADIFNAIRSRGVETWDPILLAAVSSLSQLWLLDTHGEPRLEPSTAADLEKLAFDLFNQSLARPTLATVQAGLLLIQLPDIDTKRVNTELVDAAYGLGLHLDCTSWSITHEEKRLRKRLAWALYMQDKWCSLIHGRPSAISGSNWIVKPLDLEDFESSDDAARILGRDIFIYLTGLTEILSLILDTFYTSRALEEIHSAGTAGTRMVLERAKAAQMQLKKWYSTLPPHLKLEANMENGTSSIGHLHLAYFCTEITLHRTIIRSLARGGGKDADAHLEEICRAAAKTRLISVMEFVNRLRPVHWRAFWYFPSPSAFALVASFGALLRATAPGQEEAAFYEARLQEYRWTLSVSARHAPFLNQAIASLDEAETLMQNLPEKPSAKELSEARTKAKAAAAQHNPSDEVMGDDHNGNDNDEDESADDSEDEDDADMDMDMEIEEEGTSSIKSGKSSSQQSRKSLR